MTWRQKATAIVKKHGGTIEDDSVGEDCCYQLIAPKGYYWSNAGLHMIPVSYRKRWADITWEHGYNDVCNGLTKCDESDCEFCTEVE